MFRNRGELWLSPDNSGNEIILHTHTQAEEFVVSGYETLNNQYGQEHKAVQKAVVRIVELYEKWGRTTEKEKYSRLLL